MNDDVFILAVTVAILAATAWAVVSFSRNTITTVGQLETKVANLEAELQAKDAAVEMYQQLLDAKQREIDLQEKIIRGLSLKLKVALRIKDLKERRIKDLTGENEPEQQIKDDN